MAVVGPTERRELAASPAPDRRPGTRLAFRAGRHGRQPHECAPKLGNRIVAHQRSRRRKRQARMFAEPSPADTRVGLLWRRRAVSGPGATVASQTLSGIWSMVGGPAAVTIRFTEAESRLALDLGLRPTGRHLRDAPAVEGGESLRPPARYEAGEPFPLIGALLTTAGEAGSLQGGAAARWPDDAATVRGSVLNTEYLTLVGGNRNHAVVGAADCRSERVSGSHRHQSSPGLTEIRH